MQVTHYSGYYLTQAALLLFLQSPLHDCFLQHHWRRLRGQGCEGERSLRCKWRRLYFGKGVLVSIPWYLRSFGSGLKLDRYNPSVSLMMLRNAAGASLGCRGKFWWLNRRWGILWVWIRSWVLFVWWVLGDLSEGFCNTVSPMSSESTSWDPRNHEADFKTMLCTKKV